MTLFSHYNIVVFFMHCNVLAMYLEATWPGLAKGPKSLNGPPNPKISRNLDFTVCMKCRPHDLILGKISRFNSQIFHVA